MIKIGILGDIGSGKSYMAQKFGYPVFNADNEVAKLYKKDQEPQKLEGSAIKEETLLVSLFDGRIYTLNLQNNIAANGNYILSIRMGILQDESGSANAEDSNLRGEMDLFNQKVNGRFFEISSWEGNELLLSDQ